MNINFIHSGIIRKLSIALICAMLIVSTQQIATSHASSGTVGWKDIAVGGTISLGLKKDGSVWTTGSDGFVRVKGLQGITAVAAGGSSSYALDNEGTVWEFGTDGIGLINGESISNPSAPRKVEGIRDVVELQVTAGGPLYLKKDGTVWASGRNNAGQLGIGSYEDSDEPVQVLGLKKIVKIAAHGTGFRSMALRQDGTLWSWGFGYTGDGTEWYRTKPVWIRSSEAEQLSDRVITVMLDGRTIDFERPPLFINGRTMVPLRTIFEAIGATIEWNGKTSTVTARGGARHCANRRQRSGDDERNGVQA